MHQSAAPSMPAFAVDPSPTWATYRRRADLLFRAVLVVTSAITLVWLGLLLAGRDGGDAFRAYRLTADAIGRVVVGFAIMTLLWGWLWYGVKRLLLRKLAGLTKAEADATFGSRMAEPFHLATLVAAHSERRIRIADMVGRRGRFFFLGLAAYTYVYTRVSTEPTPGFLYLGLQESLFDALVLNWLMLALYYNNGWLGRLAYGAQTRIMDGTLGRANCLVITTLWGVFKFIMVPLGLQLAALYPPSTYATVFGFVWLSYLISDGLAEVVGQSVGSQRIRVWGIGEVNRKSVAGTWACFGGSLAVCLALVALNGLGAAWVGLAVAISVSNTLLELFSPRGTDDFTMATANALWCLAFGLWVF